MPLLDHFRPPLALERSWNGFHHQWACLIVRQLNGTVLPREYRAFPEIRIGAAVDEESGEGRQTFDSTPPQPPLALPVDFAGIDTFEVRIHDERSQRLAAAVELVSPSNKDCDAHRQAFVHKCASYLQEGVALALIDVVTERSGNLHAALVEALAPSTAVELASPDALYGAAYRRITPPSGDRVEGWPAALFVGQPLPTLPLWLTADLAVPLDLDESYRATCESLRIRVA